MAGLINRARVALLATGLACCVGPTAPDVVARPQAADPSRIRIVVPEVYELANVILALTEYGQRSTTLINKGDYYKRVMSAFEPWRTSVPMRLMQLGTSDPLQRYYDFRDNSFAYLYEDAEIRRNPAYQPFRHNNVFRDWSAPAGEFALESNFRAFYAANRAYYDSLVARYRPIVSLDSMADWLEREFAPVRYAHYTVVLSPLVYGSHSASWQGAEAFMFVSGPDVTTSATSSAALRKGTVERILFTEIDHPFVNPATTRHLARVNEIFGQRAKWTTDASSFYPGGEQVFNEYMTWAAFVLYADQSRPPRDFAEVSANTVLAMEKSRGFGRFGAFTTELLRLYRERQGGQRVTDLYPAILDWAAKQ
jgi:hypothetical protein